MPIAIDLIKKHPIIPPDRQFHQQMDFGLHINQSSEPCQTIMLANQIRPLSKYPPSTSVMELFRSGRRIPANRIFPTGSAADAIKGREGTAGLSSRRLLGRGEDPNNPHVSLTLQKAVARRERSG